MGGGGGMRNLNRKPEDWETRPLTKTTLLRLLRYVFAHKWLMAAALALTVLSNLLALAGPYFSGLAIDQIEFGEGAVMFRLVFYYCAWMAVCYASSALLSYCLQRLMIIITRKVIYRMRSDVFNKLTELPVGYFDTHQTGDILSRISYDIDTISTSLSTDVVHLLASVITVVGALAMMLKISPVLVLVFVFTVPLSVFTTKFITTRTRPLFRKRSAELGELNGFVEEMISGQKTLKAYNQEENTIRKLDVRNHEAVTAYYKAEYFGGITGPTVNFINNLSLSLVSFFGALLYLGGGIGIGEISTFVLYSRKFSGPINETANIIGELQSVFSAAERVFRLLDEPVELPDVPDAEDLEAQGDVELHDVSFGYEKGNTILKNLTIKAPKGSLIAIVGPTGAGKTTLINLLMRFYDTDTGEITMDGHPIRSLQRKSLRRNYSMVLQDTWLFHGTVFDNIAYGKEDATMEEVQAACKAAGIHNYIENLPDGYNTILNDDGTNISKGQKQLMTIARAMLIDARLLILDEATSNVDTRTEIQIQKAMRKLMSDKTCFVIAHRLSTIRNADLILVVKDGQVVEQGTHDSLMEQNGFYAEMFNAQFS